jgi:hypothetical protein
MIRINLVACLAIGVASGIVGCNNSSDYKTPAELKKAPPVASHNHDHDHGAKGPHGGGIIELGEEEYHAELVVDHDSHAVVLYVLGKDAKTAEAVTATEITITPEGKTALTLKAAPQAGDAEGKTSKFELINDEVVHELMDAGFVHGDLRITIADKPYVGHIDYHLDESDHHDHDHTEEKPTEGEKK